MHGGYSGRVHVATRERDMARVVSIFAVVSNLIVVVQKLIGID